MCFSNNSPSTTIFSPFAVEAVKLMSVEHALHHVCRRRAPSFDRSVDLTATFAIAPRRSARIQFDAFRAEAKPHIASSGMLPFSVRMRRKSSSLSEASSTRIGRRPCNSGSKSEGLATWKAPEAMNRN